MDIIVTANSLKKFLSTDASAEEIAAKVSLCGPTFDRIHKKSDDYIFEIEAITNRIDSASVQGVAREAVAILNQFEISSKMINDPYKEEVNLFKELPEVLSIKVDDPALVHRFTAVVLSVSSIKESPKEVIDYLEKSGERSVNNVVDITNELTHLYGMPSHIFDFDKIKNGSLLIRESKQEESITTLDDMSYKLQGGDIVIEDGSGNLIDLCGVMGGKLAEVDQNTKNILLIVPAYHPKKIRKTSLYLQKRTLAAQIYEKQPDTELCLPVLMVAIKKFEDRAGAKVASKVFDYYPNKMEPKTILLDLNWLNKFIGINIEKQRVITILDDLGFGGKDSGDNVLECTVPSYRYYDINIKEDLAEEVARIYGYFRLPSVIPCVTLQLKESNPLLVNELITKNYLANIGFNEVFNNSLISLSLIENTLQSEESSLRLTNALSSDYEYLRYSLLPNLIINLKNNLGTADGIINIFELSNTYQKRVKGKIPDEVSILGLVSTDTYLNVKGKIESLFELLKLKNLSFSKASEKINSVFDTNKTADIYTEKIKIGSIGLINPIVANNIGINDKTVLAEIYFNKVVGNLAENYTYNPISSYPSIIEDITVESSLPVGDIIEKIKTFSQKISKVTYISSYKSKHTFKLSFSSIQNDLSQEEVNRIKEVMVTSFY